MLIFINTTYASYHILNIENLLTCQRKSVSVKVKGTWRTVIDYTIRGGPLAIQVKESRSTINANTTGEPSATYITKYGST